MRYLIVIVPFGFMYHSFMTIYVLESDDFISKFNHTYPEIEPKSFIPPQVQSKLDVYCSNVIPSTHAENSQPNGILLSVALFIRHGFRTEMSNMPADNSVPDYYCDLHLLYRHMETNSQKCISPAIFQVLKPYARFSGHCQASQLTQIGIEELELLGNYLNTTYDEFLTKAELKLKSTKVSRTIFSLAAMLKGMMVNWCDQKARVRSLLIDMKIEVLFSEP